MGIKTAHSATYSINGLDMNNTFAIAKQRSINCYAGNVAPSIPTIDIDASWVVRSKTTVIHCNKVAYLLKISTCFMKAGFNVVIVCDGTARHHSKRATIERVAQLYRNRILFLKIQNKILLIYENARKEYRSKSEQEILELKKFSSQIKILNNKISNIVYDTGDNFFKDLYERVIKIKESLSKDNRRTTTSGNINVMQAEQQADACIAARANRNISSIILSADSDQAVLLGSKCISIKSYYYNNNHNTIDRLDIFCATNTTIQHISNYINLPLVEGKDGNYIPPKYILFDDVDDDYKVRALIAVGIGCDVYTSGVKGIGPKIIHDYLIKLKSQNIDKSNYYNSIMSLYCQTVFKRKGRSMYDALVRVDEIEFENIINVFVESYLYEPGNFFINMDKIKQAIGIYIFRSPTKLNIYNKAFMRDIEVDCCSLGGADCCVGPGTGEHLFLPAEGYNKCLSCERNICHCCVFKDPYCSKKFCVECYFAESNVSKTDLDDLPTDEMMRQLFIEHGCPVNMNEDIAERINLYQNLLLNKKILDQDNYSTMVKLPEQPTTYLEELDIILEFSMKSGGSFVNNENLPFEHLIEVLEILKELVEVDEGNDSLELTSNQITPKLVTKFAEQSRIHFGWRLLIRALRHSIDLLLTDVSETFVKIFKHQEQTGIYLRMKVKSSMKKESYDTEVAFTIKTIVACRCSCKCGSNGMERIICVHILPCLELLGYFMKEALAEHILIETSHYVKKTDLSNVDNTLLTNFRKSLEIFLITCNAKNLEKALNAKSIRRMLKGFDVGTDKIKFGPAPPRSQKAMGSLKTLNFQSVTMIARNTRRGKVSTIKKKEFYKKVRDPVTYQQYQQTLEAISTFCVFLPKSSTEFLQGKMVGYRLLERRCEGKVDFNVLKKYKSSINEIKNAIEIGNSEFTYRKRNVNKNKNNSVLTNDHDSSDISDDTSIDSASINTYYTVNNYDINENEIDYNNYDGTENDFVDFNNNDSNENFVELNYNDNNENFVEFNNEDSSVVDFNNYDDSNENYVVINNNGSNENFVECNNDDCTENAIVDFHNYYDTNENEIEDEMNITTTISNNNNRKTCCVKNCTNNNKNKPDSLWYHVPFTKCKVINSNSTDRRRQRLALTLFHRRLYLSRLGLEKNDERRKIMHCDEHDLFEETHTYTYKNKNNILIQLTTDIRLPKDPNIAYKTTRQSVQTRRPFHPTKRNKTIKQKTISNNNAIKKINNNKKCDFLGCNNKHTHEADFKWKRIPPLSTIDPFNKSRTNHERKYHSINNIYRQIIRQRCGIEPNDNRKNLRICNKHPVIKEVMDVSWFLIDNETEETTNVTMYVPTKIIITNNDDSNIERARRQNQREVRNALNETGINNIINTYNSTSNSQSIRNTMSLLLNAVQHMSQLEQTLPTTFDNTPFHFDYEFKNKYKQQKVRRITKYKLNNCSDDFIKKNMGFKSLSAMISFIIIINKGDVKKLIETKTSLTWFEEYSLYFTIIWGRTCTRWYTTSERFGVGETTARLIFDNIQQKMLNIMIDWPRYTNFDEDIHLQREDKWKDLFDSTRIIMWDMTDISISQPSSAESARLCFSKYYSGCCGKGGVFLQSSSWLGTYDLWMGAVSDSEYLTRSGIFQEQEDFVLEDEAFKDIPYTNITDKGFRVTAEAYRQGGQRILQPPFMKSDQRFTREQTIEAAAIATIRSANERAVNRIKECHYVKKGLREAENINRVAAAYLTFGFQANFMFYPVQ